MRKYFSILTIIIVLIAACINPISIYASTNDSLLTITSTSEPISIPVRHPLQIKAGTVEGKPGEAVIVPVTIEDMPEGYSVNNLDFELRFDPAVLEVTSVSPGEIIINPTVNFSHLISNDLGRLVLLFSDDTGIGKESIKQNGVFVNLNIKIKPTAKAGFTVIRFQTGISENPYEPSLDPLRLISGGVYVIINGISIGDVTGDGFINSTDCTLLKRFVLGIVSEFPYPKGMENADVNKDGVINSTDYVALKRIVLGINI
ncbi:MAG: cohesin domain-containing protein [Bacillota bacterium]